MGLPELTMLIKLARTVAIAGQPAVDYRPYSKTCPPPPPVPGVKRWTLKTVCGTRSIYGFLATAKDGSTVTVTQITYAIPGVNIPAVNSVDFDNTKPFTQPQLVSTEPYCVQVRVYE